MLYRKESFTVANIAVMVESGEWDRADLCLEPPDDHGCDSAEDSGDEDFGGCVAPSLPHFHTWT